MDILISGVLKQLARSIKFKCKTFSPKTIYICKKMVTADSGADLGLSRGGGGGGGFSKRKSKVSTTFFLGRLIDFLSSPKALFCPYFGKIFCAEGRFLKKKQSKKAFLGTFWKILTKKLRFFGARSPLQISNYWRQRRL